MKAIEKGSGGDGGAAAEEGCGGKINGLVLKDISSKTNFSGPRVDICLESCRDGPVGIDRSGIR